MKISVFVGVSVDGFIARADGTLDFLDAGGEEPMVTRSSSRRSTPSSWDARRSRPSWASAVGRSSGNRALAEDLTSETFVRALVGRDDLRVGTVKAYLFTIARNLYRDVRRREARLVPLEQAADPADPSSGRDSARDGGLHLGEVLAAVQRLPESEREALVLAVDHELPYAGIAAILGCSIPAVKVRVHRARVRLRSFLDKEPKCRT